MLYTCSKYQIESMVAWIIVNMQINTYRYLVHKKYLLIPTYHRSYSRIEDPHNFLLHSARSWFSVAFIFSKMKYVHIAVDQPFGVSSVSDSPKNAEKSVVVFLQKTYSFSSFFFGEYMTFISLSTYIPQVGHTGILSFYRTIYLRYRMTLHFGNLQFINKN